MNQSLRQTALEAERLTIEFSRACATGSPARKHGNPNGTDYEQGVNDHGYRWVHQLRALSTSGRAE